MEQYSKFGRTSVKNAEALFLHTGYGYLRFYPVIENLILLMLSLIIPGLSREGCTLVVLELTHMVVK